MAKEGDHTDLVEFLAAHGGGTRNARCRIEERAHLTNFN